MFSGDDFGEVGRLGLDNYDDSEGSSAYVFDFDGLHVKFDDGSRRFDDVDHAHGLLDELARQRKTGKFLDLVVDVDGKEFPCHRAVLASTPYFETMLLSSFAEGNLKVVPLRGIDSSSFSKILDFLYTGKIRIGKDDVQNILQAAHMLQFENIVQYCRQFMEKNVCPSNCLGIMHLADKYGLSYLKTRARNEALWHFSKVCHNEEFLTLSAQELLDILADEDLEVTNEDVVVFSVIRWLDCASEVSTTAISAILEEIRLSCVRVSALRKLESHAVIRESPEWLAKITAAKEEHLHGGRQIDAGAQGSGAERKPRKRISDDLAIIVGGWKAVKRDSADENPPHPTPLQSIVCINPDCRHHYHVTNLPTPVSGYMSATCAEGRLYVTGGRVHSLVGLQGSHIAPSRQAFCYDFPSDTWTLLPDMPLARAEHQSVVVDGRLFVVGGDAEPSPVMSMDCYDLEEGAWIKPPMLPTINTSSKIMATAFGDKLLIVELSESIVDHLQVEEGVYYEVQPVCDQVPLLKVSIHAFDVKTEHWVYREILGNRIIVLGNTLENCRFETVVAAGKMYVFTPEIHKSDIYAYDVDEETLTKVDIENSTICTRHFLIAEDYSHEEFHGGQKGIIDRIHSYSFQGYLMRGTRDAILPFALFGHSFIGTSKSSIGWYCRDLAKLERQDD